MVGTRGTVRLVGGVVVGAAGDGTQDLPCVGNALAADLTGLLGDFPHRFGGEDERKLN